ncbi:hypothetical protein LZG04_11650 [Saccharothrix sp. S26]|uniref:hypothetical protein n=1 Tax=Saccharothrix sp. S26 TaxID=2907215 RepID=UPI001F331B18|nr:hypothetical protein [Saccharothrix sp. S26]MCE6995454.1 hypothetical protein [Saccharothrix sp. S26]
MEPGEAADMARRAAKEAGARVDELRQWRTEPRTGRPAGGRLGEAEQRARLAAARAVHRMARSSTRRTGVDGKDHR